MKKLSKILVFSLILILTGMKSNKTEKYYMIAYYDLNELSARWYVKNDRDTITLDSGCITNNFTKFDYKNNKSFYRVCFFDYNEYSNAEFLNNIPINSYQISEFNYFLTRRLKNEFNQYIDTNLCSQEKNIQQLDTTDCLYIQRRTNKKNQRFRFYRVFIVSSNKKILKYKYNDSISKLREYINYIDYISVFTRKKRVNKDGDTINIEVFDNTTILNEIMCENCFEYKGFNYPPGMLVFKAKNFKTIEVYYNKGKYKLDKFSLNSRLNTLNALKRELNEIGNLMKTNSKLILSITEYTDKDETDDYNQRLAQNRINEIKYYLKNKYNISEDKFKISNKENSNENDEKNKNRKIKLNLFEYY